MRTEQFKYSMVVYVLQHVSAKLYGHYELVYNPYKGSVIEKEACHITNSEYVFIKLSYYFKMEK